MSQRSLRFIRANECYLQRNHQALNRRTFTISTWVKRSSIGAQHTITSFDGLNLYLGETYGRIAAEGRNLSLHSNEVILADNTWHHILLAVDTTLVTQADRAKLYLDGVEVTYVESTRPNQNDQYFGSSASQYWFIGKSSPYSNALDALLDETYFIDGYQLTPSSFVTAYPGGPKIYTGAFGSGGFYLDFEDPTSTATLCYDKSGNAKHWTPNNLTVGDSSTDVPQIYLEASDLTIGSPVFDAPEVSSATINAVDLEVGSPTFDAPALQAIGESALIALDGSVLGPELGQPSFLSFKDGSVGTGWAADASVRFGLGQVAPDGSDEGVLLIDTAGAGPFRAWQAVTKAAEARTYRLTVDAASVGSGKNIELRLDDGASAYAYAIFDPATGECLKRDCTTDFRILAVEEDPTRYKFRRLVMMAQSNAALTVRGMLSLCDGLDTSYTGDGTGAVVVWSPRLLEDFDRRDFRWEIGQPEMRFYWTVHISEVGLTWFRCGQGELGVDPHLRFRTAPDLDCVLRRWQPAQDALVFDFSGALLVGSGDPMAGTP